MNVLSQIVQVSFQENRGGFSGGQVSFLEDSWQLGTDVLSQGQVSFNDYT